MSKMKLHTVENEICKVHIVLDDVPPIQWAMAAAMFSRSNDGIETIIEKITPEKAESFMEKFYVGYSHESIGDLVDVKLFVEGIPFYVAAALEHHSAFRGQESSTRYIDFSKQKPAYSADKELYAQQIEFYLNATRQVKENILSHNQHNIPSAGPDASIHLRAISARAFDITRGLLPLGATTNVAWYGSVRSIKRHLAWLIAEFSYADKVGKYAQFILDSLREVYPESVEAVVRPANPWPMGEEFHYEMEGKLDFGSWRDLNRHRIGNHSFDLPMEDSHFSSWYGDRLTANGINPFDRPESIDLDSCYLGQEINVSYMCNKEQFEYVVKLRSKPTVHGSLRDFIQEQHQANDCWVDIDDTPDAGNFGYFVQRGNDTITIKS